MKSALFSPPFEGEPAPLRSGSTPEVKYQEVKRFTNQGGGG